MRESSLEFPFTLRICEFYESANSIVVVSEKQNRHSLPELRLGPFAGQAYVGMSSGLGVHAADSMASELQGSWAQCMSVSGLGEGASRKGTWIALGHISS